MGLHKGGSAKALLFVRDKSTYLYEEVTYMNTIKNIVIGTITYAALSAAAVIGIGIGGELWEKGLKDKVDEKVEKWFS